VIDSRPGARGAIAAEAVARARARRQYAARQLHRSLINAILRKVSSDPLTSFEPVCKLVASPLVIGRQRRLALSYARRPCSGGTRAAR